MGGTSISSCKTNDNSILRRADGHVVYVFVAMLISVSLCQNATGQDMLLQMDGNERQMYKQFMDLYDQQKQRATFRIKACLADIENACELTDAQQKKLSVAAKGAIEAQAKKIVSQLKKAAPGAQFKFDPDNPPELVEDESEDEKPMQGGRLRVVSAQSDGSVDTTKTWVSAIEKTLTDEQIESLNRWIEKRNQRIRQSVVAQYVVMADARLFLTEQQFTRFTETIDKTIGNNLVAQVSSNNRQPRWIRNRIGGVPPKITVKPRIGEILSDAQREIWRIEFQQGYDQILRARPNDTSILQPAFKTRANK